MKIINTQSIKHIESFDKSLDRRFQYDKENDMYVFLDTNVKKEDINHYYLLEIKDKIYEKPHLKITYVDGNRDRLYFDTIEEAEEYAKHSLCNHIMFKELNKGILV